MSPSPKPSKGQDASATQMDNQQKHLSSPLSRSPASRSVGHYRCLFRAPDDISEKVESPSKESRVIFEDKVRKEVQQMI